MSDESVPNPVRFWWLKRLSVAGAAAVVALAAVRWWWGYEMNRRLESAVAAIEAKGEPIRFEDMRRPPVPDEENKAYYLRHALATWPRVGGQLVTETNWYTERDQHADPIADNAAYLKRCEPALELLRQAAAAPRMDWGVQLMAAPIQLLLPQLGEMRTLARLVDDAAQRAQRDERHRLVLGLVEQELAIAQAAETGRPPSLISHLVGIAIRVMATERLQDALPGMPPAAIAPGGDAADIADRLIDRLLDEKTQRRLRMTAYIGERWMMHHTALSVVSGRLTINRPSPYSRFFGVLTKPALVVDAQLLLNCNTAYVEAAARASSLPECRTILSARMPDLQQKIDEAPWAHVMTAILSPAYEGAIETQYRHLANLRMAGIAMAIKRFEADHGERPTALEELVPRYLAAVPVDPLANDGRGIGYKPRGVMPQVIATKPASAGHRYGWSGLRSAASAPSAPAQITAFAPAAILYSVGSDGDDDGAPVYLSPDHELMDTYRYLNNGDQVFLLDRPQALAPSNTSAQQRVTDQPQPGD